MPASITIDDTHPLFPRVLALLAGSVDSPGGTHDLVTCASPAGQPAALPPAPSPPAAAADPVVERAPAARSVTRPATVGPRKASGGATPLPFAEPAATPPAQAPTGKVHAPVAAGGDAQRGTAGAGLNAEQSGTANGTPSPEAASAASTIVARVVAALSGSVERVEPSPPRRPTRAPSPKSATGTADPDFTPELLETAGF